MADSVADECDGIGVAFSDFLKEHIAPTLRSVRDLKAKVMTYEAQAKASEAQAKTFAAQVAALEDEVSRLELERQERDARDAERDARDAERDARDAEVQKKFVILKGQLEESERQNAELRARGDQYLAEENRDFRARLNAIGQIIGPSLSGLTAAAFTAPALPQVVGRAVSSAALQLRDMPELGDGAELPQVQVAKDQNASGAASPLHVASPPQDLDQAAYSVPTQPRDEPEPRDATERSQARVANNQTTSASDAASLPQALNASAPSSTAQPRGKSSSGDAAVAPQHRSTPAPRDASASRVDPPPTLIIPPTFLPPRSAFYAWCDNGGKKYYENLPGKTQDALRTLFNSFASAKNQKYGGLEFWTKLRRWHRDESISPLCLGVFMANGKKCTWTREGPGKYACMTCTNAQQPCLLFEDVNMWLRLLPVVEEARFGSPDYEPGYWVCSVEKVTLARKDLRGLWADAPENKRKASTDLEGSEGAGKVQKHG